jgi:C1A family cysteine protease
MSSLPVRNKSRYGWNKDLPDPRDRRFAVAEEDFAHLPSNVDLRPKCPPVYNQGRIGSCTANAIAGAFEFDVDKQGVEDFVPSRLFIYWNERALEGSTATDSGAQIRDGVKVVATLGVPDEDELPYDDTPAGPDGVFPPQSRAAMKPPASVFADATHNEAVVYERVTQDLDHLKSVLAQGFPIIFGIVVFSSFEDQATIESGDVPLPGPFDQVMGGHAIVLVGYDDAKQRFIFRNSWGTVFGQAGYGTLPYEYVTNGELASDFWTIRRVS